MTFAAADDRVFVEVRNSGTRNGNLSEERAMLVFRIEDGRTREVYDYPYDFPKYERFWK